jgi:hypothetical protein
MTRENAMWKSPRATALSSGVLAAACVLGSASAQQPDVAAVLDKSAKYLAEYEKAFSVVVAEESYSQSVLTIAGGRTTRQQRILRSDVLQTSVGQADWVAFRDVFQVDGIAVRDRDTRLQKLFLEAPSQALAQTRRIVDESARYNIGSLHRNINVPTMALTYVRAANQARSAFTIAGVEKIDGVNAVVLAFVEKTKPTIVRSGSRDLPATGRVWIDPESGRVLKTEVSIAGAGSPAKITVTYGPVPKLTTWAPLQMKEDYAGRDTGLGTETIRAEATYSNFRQFTVAVAEKIKH